VHGPVGGNRDDGELRLRDGLDWIGLGCTDGICYKGAYYTYVFMAAYSYATD